MKLHFAAAAIKEMEALTAIRSTAGFLAVAALIATTKIETDKRRGVFDILIKGGKLLGINKTYSIMRAAIALVPADHALVAKSLGVVESALQPIIVGGQLEIHATIRDGFNKVGSVAELHAIVDIMSLVEIPKGEIPRVLDSAIAAASRLEFQKSTDFLRAALALGADPQLVAYKTKCDLNEVLAIKVGHAGVGEKKVDLPTSFVSQLPTHNLGGQFATV